MGQMHVCMQEKRSPQGETTSTVSVLSGASVTAAFFNSIEASRCVVLFMTIYMKLALQHIIQTQFMTRLSSDSCVGLNYIAGCGHCSEAATCNNVRRTVCSLQAPLLMIKESNS